jgi:hypothetical protein
MMGNDFEILHPKSRNYARRTHHLSAAAGRCLGGNWIGRLIYHTDVDVFHMKSIQHFIAKIVG